MGGKKKKKNRRGAGSSRPGRTNQDGEEPGNDVPMQALSPAERPNGNEERSHGDQEQTQEQVHNDDRSPENNPNGNGGESPSGQNPTQGASNERVAVGVCSVLLILMGLINMGLGIYLHTIYEQPPGLPWSWTVHIVCGAVVTGIGAIFAIAFCTKATLDKVNKWVVTILGVSISSIVAAIVQLVTSHANDAFYETKLNPDFHQLERLGEICFGLSVLTFITAAVIIVTFVIGFFRRKYKCFNCYSCLGNPTEQEQWTQTCTCPHIHRRHSHVHFSRQ